MFGIKLTLEYACTTIPNSAIEDAYLYSKLNTWTEIATYFDTILQEELDFGVDEAVLRQWHTMLQTYITQQPTMQTIADFCADSGHHIYTLCNEFDLDQHFNQLCSTPRFADVVDTFYCDFPTHALAQAYTLNGALQQVLQMSYAAC